MQQITTSPALRQDSYYPSKRDIERATLGEEVLLAGPQSIYWFRKALKAAAYALYVGNEEFGRTPILDEAERAKVLFEAMRLNTDIKYSETKAELMAKCRRAVSGGKRRFAVSLDQRDQWQRHNNHEKFQSEHMTLRALVQLLKEYGDRFFGYNEIAKRAGRSRKAVKAAMDRLGITLDNMRTGVRPDRSLVLVRVLSTTVQKGVINTRPYTEEPVVKPQELNHERQEGVSIRDRSPVPQARTRENTGNVPAAPGNSPGIYRRVRNSEGERPETRDSITRDQRAKDRPYGLQQIDPILRAERARLLSIQRGSAAPCPLFPEPDIVDSA